MVSQRLALAACAVITACSSHPRHPKPVASTGGAGTSEVTLYRDHAVVAQRVEVVIPPASVARVRVKVAAGVTAEDIYIVDKGELTIRQARVVGGVGSAPPPPPQKKKPAAPSEDDEDETPPKPVPDHERPLVPTEVELEIGGLREGKYVLGVGYDTERITWDAAYTMTTTAARDQATLRGAIAIRNATGLPLHNADVWIVDAEHGPATGRIAERLGSQLVGTEPSSTPIAIPRNLGRADLVDGDTRIELLANAPPRKMRSVLVYDPIGTKLDHGGAAPVRDTALGVHPSASPRVTESFEVVRDIATSAGLPAGPVRLLERHADGSLALLGQARLFDIATRIADVDTVAVGTAEGVTGKRERRELTIDDDTKRLVEEFVVTIENKRDRPVEVVLHEHLYRGQNWTLAYQSAPVATKEGPQQISLRLVAPSKGQSKILYVVVYTW
jgi:hypothetical protein